MQYEMSASVITSMIVSELEHMKLNLDKAKK